LLTGELVGERDGTGSESRHARQGAQGNARGCECAVNLRLLIAHDAPGGGVTRRRHVAYRVSGFGKVLCQSAAHVVVVKVIDHYRARQPHTGGDIVGSEYAGSRELTDRDLERRIQEARPAAPGRDHDVRRLQLENVRGGEKVAPVEVDVRQPLELPAAPVEHPSPGGEPGQSRLEAQPSADLL